jgi:ATP phosphoribosyltransferase regulatory subunit
MRAVLDVMDAHGFDRVSPPLIEFERSLAARMSGVSSRRMFRFVDPASLRTLSLRNDITVQIGRIASTGLAEAARPLRLCYAGEIVNIDGRQLEPRRQKLQMGAELIGSDSAQAAAEMTVLAVDALIAAGAKDVSVDFTLPDLVDTLAAGAMPLEPHQVEAVRRELDTKDAGGLRDAGGAQYLPLLYAGGPFEEAIGKLSAIDAGGALASRIAGLRLVAERLAGKARLTLDPSERHGFEYQSWMGFTLFADGLPGALGRGGTYTIQGDREEPSTGFSLYPDRLIDLLAGDAKARDMIFLPMDAPANAGQDLRRNGWRTLAAIAQEDDPRALGCTHVWEAGEARPL